MGAALEGRRPGAAPAGAWAVTMVGLVATASLATGAGVADASAPPDSAGSSAPATEPTPACLGPVASDEGEPVASTETVAPDTVAAETVAAETVAADAGSTTTELVIPLPGSDPGDSAVAPSPPATDPALVLGRDGIGSTHFCDDADSTVATLTAVLGPPDDDTGWVDPLTVSSCSGTVARRVTWGSLDLYFGDESRFATGYRHFFGYSYGDVDGFDATPAGLATPEGIGLGTSVAFLEAAYPQVELIAGEEGIQEPTFYVDESLSGLLTDVADDGVVTLLIGGEACGV